ncbi:DUF3019 domain-containing protein [Pseudoalteromonas luteoviolacea]|uniref:DUF3019 domain-containing protein n=1 Tax=Pseudoalteromonas luteoviolacea NCIMB 1942 TaxID=1365253 RepID=A0A162A473_9GAMM|nr:DUF3019 domain-containing protein [Pseudoalteromonas luteoviolacea]KZN43841.1 hypothetical protein N482_18610 [Pseudoalteromonas luteoviolacea NCIMB 1942]
MNFKWPYALMVSVCLVATKTSNVYAAPNSKAELKVKPMICMVKSIGQICEMTIAIQWQTTTAQDVCLYQDTQQLKCWQDTQQAKAKLNISLEQDMTFSLKNARMETLTSQKVKVNAALSRKYRRKLKSDWSFF